MKERRNDYKIVFEQQKNFILKSCLDFDHGDEAEAIRIAGHLRTMLHDSYHKRNFDSKLIYTVLEIKGLIENEGFTSKKKALNKLNGLRQKIEQLQKKQILSKSLLTQLKQKEKIKFIDTTLPKGSFSFYKNSTIINTTVISKSYFGLLAKEVNTKDGKEVVKYSPLCSFDKSEKYFENCPTQTFEDWWHQIIYDDGVKTVFSRKDLITFVANHDGYAHVEENIDTKYQNFKEANILENFINSNRKEKVNLATLNSVRQIAFEVMWSIKNIS
jgi:hypothetical protein